MNNEKMKSCGEYSSSVTGGFIIGDDALSHGATHAILDCVAPRFFMSSRCPGWVHDSGDTGMMMVATAFVMLQTPALGLAQAGMIRRKNALSMLVQTLFGMALGSLLWFVIGFTMTFGDSHDGFIGKLDHIFLLNVTGDCPFPTIGGTAGTIPGVLFACFQMMFALMAPVIVTGAWAERMTFPAFAVFTLLWPFLVYYPLAHWIWNPLGFLAREGVLDFAGGLVIHASTGVAALAVSFVLHGRLNQGRSAGTSHHNLPLSTLGASLIWAGWYFFNAGSAYHANDVAASAVLNTHLSASSGAIVWSLLAYYHDRTWSLTGIFNGAFSALAAITAGSGFVNCRMAVLTGSIASMSSFVWVRHVKTRLGLDDALDVAALQGVPGLVGTLMLSFGAPGYTWPDERLQLIGLQIYACLITVVWAGFWTLGLMYFIKMSVGIDIDLETEAMGLDLAQIGEQAYDETLSPILDLGSEVLTSRLCDACLDGDLRRVRTLINMGADPDLTDYDSRTPLHIAAAEGHMHIVRYLQTRHDVNINHADRYGNTPLSDAIAARRLEVVEYLEQNGAVQHLGMSTSARSCADLIESCAKGRADEVRIRIRLCCDINGCDYDGRTALHVSAAEGYESIVKLLIDNGADMCVRDRWHQTPRHNAVRFRHYRAASLLALAGDHQGSSCPQSRARSRSCACSPKGSFIEDPPLGPGQCDACEVRVGDEGAEPIADDSLAREFILPMFINTSVFAVVQAASRGDVAEFRLLVCKGASPHATDYDGRSPLHLASCNGHIELVRHLVQDLEVNVNVFDRFGNTPLQDAIAFGHAEVIDILRKAGATLKDAALARKLCWAAARGDLEEIRILAACGADLNTGDHDGRTALHLAASEGQVDVVSFLINTGVQLRPTDRWGGSPLDDARREGHGAIVTLLEKTPNKRRLSSPV